MLMKATHRKVYSPWVWISTNVVSGGGSHARYHSHSTHHRAHTGRLHSHKHRLLLNTSTLHTKPTRAVIFQRIHIARSPRFPPAKNKFGWHHPEEICSVFDKAQLNSRISISRVSILSFEWLSLTLKFHYEQGSIKCAWILVPCTLNQLQILKHKLSAEY